MKWIAVILSLALLLAGCSKEEFSLPAEAPTYTDTLLVKLYSDAPGRYLHPDTVRALAGVVMPDVAGKFGELGVLLLIDPEIEFFPEQGRRTTFGRGNSAQRRKKLQQYILSHPEHRYSHRHGDYANLVLLLQSRTGGHSTFVPPGAWDEQPAAVVASINPHRYAYEQYRQLIAHELGHAVLNAPHPTDWGQPREETIMHNPGWGEFRYEWSDWVMARAREYLDSTDFGYKN